MSLPPLSISILGTEPIDEFIKEIADFIHHTIKNRPNLEGNIEVEAKVGLLKTKDSSNQRLKYQLPILVETIIDPSFDNCRFESNMSPMQHKHFNQLLNKLKISPDPPTPSPLDYHHYHHIDLFYVHDNDREKIRVTKDEKTGEVVESIKKIRLANLNIVSPKWNADWRISVNLEAPMNPPAGASPTHQRRKDRISYRHEECKIDLTQVHSTSASGVPELLHELEVEIARPALLLATAMVRGEPSVSEGERYAFDELIRVFVNNTRILVRSCIDQGWS